MLSEIIDRMVAIKQQEKELKSEYDKLQAQLQINAEADLTDTKIKSIRYCGSGGNTALITTEDTVSIEAVELLQAIFGRVYNSFVTQEVKYTLKAPAKRILSALWHGEYCSGSIAEIIENLSCDDKKKKVLAKKIKGINFEKDKENFINIAGLSETEASDTAYFANEAAAWENICAIAKVNNDGVINNEILSDILTKVNAAVTVSRGLKTKLSFADGTDEG